MCDVADAGRSRVATCTGMPASVVSNLLGRSRADVVCMKSAEHTRIRDTHTETAPQLRAKGSDAIQVRQ